MTKTTSFSTKRLVSDAVFIALYVALSFASVRIGGFKLTIAALPTVLCAVVCSWSTPCSSGCSARSSSSF